MFPDELECCRERLLGDRRDDRGVRAVGPDCEGCAAAVSAANLVGLILSALVTVFLVIALIFPEKF
jgi:hypothetical protein